VPVRGGGGEEEEEEDPFLSATLFVTFSPFESAFVPLVEGSDVDDGDDDDDDADNKRLAFRAATSHCALLCSSPGNPSLGLPLLPLLYLNVVDFPVVFIGENTRSIIALLERSKWAIVARQTGRKPNSIVSLSLHKELNHFSTISTSYGGVHPFPLLLRLSK